MKSVASTEAVWFSHSIDLFELAGIREIIQATGMHPKAAAQLARPFRERSVELMAGASDEGRILGNYVIVWREDDDWKSAAVGTDDDWWSKIPKSDDGIPATFTAIPVDELWLRTLEIAYKLLGEGK